MLRHTAGDGGAGNAGEGRAPESQNLLVAWRRAMTRGSRSPAGEAWRMASVALT